MAPKPSRWRLQALYASAELCLIGDASSLDALGRALQESLEAPIMVDLLERDPAPYDGCFLSLVVDVSDGPVVIGRNGTELTIHGGREQDPADPLAHIHLERCPTIPAGTTSGLSRCRWSQSSPPKSETRSRSCAFDHVPAALRALLTSEGRKLMRG